MRRAGVRLLAGAGPRFASGKKEEAGDDRNGQGCGFHRVPSIGFPGQTATLISAVRSTSPRRAPSFRKSAAPRSVRRFP
jgi:hypothetical protein